MSNQISSEIFTTQVMSLLQESFEKVNGIYLDSGTSFFETLASLTAAQASRSIIENGSTIAAHVEHTRFYIRILEAYMDKHLPQGTDWSQSWLVKTVNDNEWNSLRDQLKEDYDRLVGRFKATDWNDENRLGGTLAIIAHTAYHLGAIRQMSHLAKR